MTVEQLQDRLNKANIKIARIEKTLERYHAQAEKKLAVLTKNGWQPDPYLYNDGKHEEAYWAAWAYLDKLDGIRSSQKNLAEAKRIAEGWQAKLSIAKAKERSVGDMPAVLLQLADQLAGMLYEDTKRQIAYTLEKYHSIRDTVQKSLFYSKHFNILDMRNMSDYQLRKQSHRDAVNWVYDLKCRVEDYIGEIEKYEDIHFSNKALNGRVYGECGVVSVETILAGGYNIQRLHFRVLVKKIKPSGR